MPNSPAKKGIEMLNQKEGEKMFIDNYITKNVDEYLKGNESILFRKTMASVYLAFIASIIQLVTRYSLLILFGVKISWIFILLIFAPITEEYCKKIAIQKQFPWVFVTFFSLYEAISYFLYYLWFVPILSLLLIRTLAIILHFATISYMYFKSDKNYIVPNAALAIAVIIHSIYNFINLIFVD